MLNRVSPGWTVYVGQSVRGAQLLSVGGSTTTGTLVFAGRGVAATAIAGSVRVGASIVLVAVRSGGCVADSRVGVAARSAVSVQAANMSAKHARTILR